MSTTTVRPKRSGKASTTPGAVAVGAGRDQLIAELDRRIPGRTRLELIVLRDADGLDPLLDADADTCARVAGALLAAAHRHRASLYRLEASVHAYVSADGRGRQSPAASASASVSEISEKVAGTMVVGHALVPGDAVDGSDALRLALDRLRGRCRLTRGSAERQVRDVLLQVLSECGPSRSAVVGSRVAADAVAVGRRLGMDLAELDVLVRAAELQDLGKLAIPDRILGKAAPLTSEEWEAVRQHPLAGERILGAAPALEPVARVVRSCSEHFDGSGYPDGLSGREIPLGARVIAVCVAFDAMTSPRPYRPAMSDSEAFGEVFRGSGTQFDPMVVAAFCAATGTLVDSSRR